MHKYNQFSVSGTSSRESGGETAIWSGALPDESAAVAQGIAGPHGSRRDGLGFAELGAGSGRISVKAIASRDGKVNMARLGVSAAGVPVRHFNTELEFA